MSWSWQPLPAAAAAAADPEAGELLVVSAGALTMTGSSVHTRRPRPPRRELVWTYDLEGVQTGVLS